MILTVTPNPCIDKTVFIDELRVGTFMRAPRYSVIAGGKGTNVARAVRLMGRPATAMVIVGGHTGAHVVDLIRNQDGMDCVPVEVVSPTRTITTVLEEPIRRQTAFFEPGSQVTPEEYARIVETFRASVTGVRVVAFSGTVSDPAIRTLYRDLIPIAKAAGAITILDAHGPEFRLGLESLPYMVKPNQVELEELCGYALDTDAARHEAMDHLHGLGIELVVLSLGKDGALVSRAGERFHVTPPAIQELNPVGSGDALVAGFAIGLLEGLPVDAMARLGVAMGAANAMSWEIGHFTRAEVEEIQARIG